ncbi:hypothetical protein [Phaeovulum sp. NW3]|uniref:hypothetical protein n=1 Tax=Phaeovulum sp. NW3 TaxID=2934933 RepID=UPI0020224BFE|nr:hypothetical protein [Phaeovulum sp. NW3]MCL7466841.1 hypothetical protein [Phaeovulum sp. NW3]
MKPTRKKHAKTRTPVPSPYLDLLSVSTPKGRRALTDDERETLILMLAHKTAAPAFDLDRLAPQGSYPRAMLRHFDDTDISFAMPLFQLVMVAASWLTQNGAYLDVPGTNPIRPTLWTIGLAESGSAKTLATDRVWKILSTPEGGPVNRLGMVSSDAQWIIDLEEDNGAFWFQDEVGKFIREMNTSTKLSRLKAWMLETYSSAAIGNRLKGEEKKLVIEDPHFTFHGMTVFSTWPQDVNATTMMDGWCQRMNYYVAPARTDTTMFDHFIYFEGADVEVREAALRETWKAICAQPAACGAYTMAPTALPDLRGWWKSLEKSWGDFALPASFMRRIGFSVLRYMVVIQFLLGKSRLAIDMETASIATAFAEYHMESALLLVQSYDRIAATHVSRIVEMRNDMIENGDALTARNISRRLSKAARAAVSTPMIQEILAVLEKVEQVGQEGFLAEIGAKEKSEIITEGWAKDIDRIRLNERKRNERRLRELRKAYRDPVPACAQGAGEASADSNVIAFRTPVDPPDDEFQLLGVN